MSRRVVATLEVMAVVPRNWTEVKKEVKCRCISRWEHALIVGCVSPAARRRVAATARAERSESHGAETETARAAIT